MKAATDPLQKDRECYRIGLVRGGVKMFSSDISSSQGSESEAEPCKELGIWHSGKSLFGVRALRSRACLGRGLLDYSVNGGCIFRVTQRK